MFTLRSLRAREIIFKSEGLYLTVRELYVCMRLNYSLTSSYSINSDILSRVECSPLHCMRHCCRVWYYTTRMLWSTYCIIYIVSRNSQIHYCYLLHVILLYDWYLLSLSPSDFPHSQESPTYYTTKRFVSSIVLYAKL